mgnify:CR=1 FL=1
MRIVCSRDNLIEGVNIVLKAVPSKTTMPILQSILIDCNNSRIKLMANDMELGIETIIDGEIIERGMIAIDAKFFSDMVRKLPDGFITIESDSSMKTSIICSQTNFYLPAKSGDDFPYIDHLEKNNCIILSQYTLKEIIRQTVFSLSDNENNKIMTGELFKVTGDTLMAIALDGHRISVRNVKLNDSYEDKKIIIPGKTLNEISKILTGNPDSEVKIYIEESSVMFEFDNTVVISRLIEGEYFDVNKMITDNYSTRVLINKIDFLNCIDRANLLVKEGEKKPIVINITEENAEIKINSAYGAFDENISISKTGENLMIGFNPKFIMDVLKVIDEEDITIYLMGPKSPCFIRDEEKSYVYIILPVNFNSN